MARTLFHITEENYPDWVIIILNMSTKFEYYSTYPVI